MMRNLLFIAFAFFALGLSAQSVVISEDFQDEDFWGDPDNIAIDPDDTDSDWVSFDSDGLSDANGRPQNWFLTLDFIYNTDISPVDPVDSNLVMASSSWLAGYAPGNLNYLILPPVDVTGADFTFTWSAAPFQGPRFMDGYEVRVSTSGDNLAEDFTDVLWQSAQMTDIGADAGAAPFDIANYTFSDGFIHADGFTLTDFFTEDAGSTAYTGLLEPQTVSLANYVGMEIYIAIVHNSDDDNMIMVDDITVEGSVGINDFQLDNLVNFYPNPVTDQLNMTFTNMITDGSVFEVYDLNGKKVISEVVYPESNPNVIVDWTALNSGLYNVRFIVDGVASQGTNIVKL